MVMSCRYLFERSHLYYTAPILPRQLRLPYGQARFRHDRLGDVPQTDNAVGEVDFGQSDSHQVL